MTEREWWATPDPAKLVDWLISEFQPTDRKFRLFACACCQRVGPLLDTDELFSQLLPLVEAAADGPVDLETLDRLRRAVLLGMRGNLTVNNLGRLRWHAHNAVLAMSSPPNEREPLYRMMSDYEEGETGWSRAPYVKVASEAAIFAYKPYDRAEALAVQVRLLHDIFGPLPFRDIAADPAWLTTDVQLLTRGSYEERAFDRMPILADALQDAGCDNDEILNHCRAEGWEHVRGCWVIDLLLGRPWREPR